MTRKIKLITVVFLLSLMAYAISANAIIVPLIRGAIKVVQQVGLTPNQVGGLLVGSGLAYGYQTSQTIIDPDGSDDTNPEIRIPMTSRDRDRPVANPQLPANKPLDNPPATNSSKICPANHVSGNNQSYSCIYRTTYSYSKVNESTCNVTVSNNAISGCEDYPWVIGTPFTTTEPTIQGCPSGYTYNGSGCSINPETPPCSTGYVSQNGQCTLTEPEKIPDKNCDLQVTPNSSGGKLIKSNNDPDCVAQRVNVSPDGVANIPVNLENPETGETEEYNVIVVPDGAGSNCYYQICIPVPNLPGHYQIGITTTGTAPNTTKYTVTSINGDGVVDGVRSGTMAGTITQSGTYVDANGNTQTIVVGQPVLTQVNSAGQVVQAQGVTQTQVINLPSDYARTGESSAAADKIVNKLSETDTLNDLASPNLINPLVQYFNPLYSWSPYISNGTCPAGSFSWNENTYDFNQFCTLFEQYSPAIQSVMMVVSIVFSLFIVLGA